MIFIPNMGGSRGGERVRTTPGKSQVPIDFLRNTGTDPPQEAIGPKGVQLFLEGVRGSIASRGRSIWSSVPLLMTKNSYYVKGPYKTGVMLLTQQII